MYKERLELYKDLEKTRGSKLLVYVTGDRQGLETQIHPEVLDFLVSHLDAMGVVPKISLYLYTRGGHTLAAWSIAHLVNQFCDSFEVIIPAKAQSGGTLICLGASGLVMTKQATLGPIDPSVNTPLNPQIPGDSPTARYPVSVEAINGFIELAKDIGKRTGADMTSFLASLTARVEPLVLGQAYRTRGQIRMLGDRLLSKHMRDGEKIEQILQFLCSESGSHDYTIYRQEAREQLGLNVETPDPELYRVIKAVYDNIASELKLTEPYNPNVVLAEQDEVTYEFRRAIVESVDGGSHQFRSEGQLKRIRFVDPTSGLTQEGVQDRRRFEGWKHERI